MSSMLRWSEEQLSEYNKRLGKGVLQCAACGTTVERAGPTQKYCAACSEARDLERKRQWARNNPPSSEKTREREAEVRDAIAEAGEIIGGCGVGIGEIWRSPDLAWIVRFSVPFTYAASKNHIYAMRSRGHVAMRRESRDLLDAIAGKAKEAIQGVHLRMNKVWVDLYVQKPNHKGDAINVVDLVCDGLKVGLGIDDRWFAIRSIDWQIVKSDPRLFIGIGQEECEDAQACSSCGRILPLHAFHKNAGALHGVMRNCRECRSLGSRLRREQKEAAV